MFICVNTSIDYPTKQFIHDICQALCTIEMKTVVSKVFYKKVLITHTRGFSALPCHTLPLTGPLKCVEKKQGKGM